MRTITRTRGTRAYYGLFERGLFQLAVRLHINALQAILKIIGGTRPVGARTQPRISRGVFEWHFGVVKPFAFGIQSLEASSEVDEFLVENLRTIDENGDIYKVSLDGQVVGKFGRAGKLPKEFGTVNAIDCRRENEILVGEQGNWRVQKVTLH